MKIIDIKGEIGWDVSPQYVKEALEESNGQNIFLDIASPGGSVFDAIEIYNLISDYEGFVIVRLKGLVASAATYIAMAGDKIEAAKNAIFMIHNPTAFVYGDQNEFKKESELLNKITDLIANVYVAKTGKDKETIRLAMNETTWLFGEEIKNYGFADTMIEKAETTGETDMHNAVNATIAKMHEEIQNHKNVYTNSFPLSRKKVLDKPEKVVENKNELKQEDVKMDIQEFKQNHVTLYQEVFNLGKNAEYERVTAHLEFYKNDIDKKHVISAIEEKIEMTTKEMAHYTAASLRNNTVKSIVADSPEKNLTNVKGEKVDEVVTVDENITGVENKIDFDHIYAMSEKGVK